MNAFELKFKVMKKINAYNNFFHSGALISYVEQQEEIMNLQIPLRPIPLRPVFSDHRADQLADPDDPFSRGILLGQKAEHSKALPLLNPAKFQKAGIDIVEWPVYAESDLATPIKTSEMNKCCAMAIINRKKNKQYLLHLNPQNKMLKNLRSHLKHLTALLTDPHTEFHILPGDSSKTKLTIDDLLKTLRSIIHTKRARICFRHFPKDSVRFFNCIPDVTRNLAVLVHQGQVYYLPKKSEAIRFIPGGKPMSKEVIPTNY